MSSVFNCPRCRLLPMDILGEGKWKVCAGCGYATQIKETPHWDEDFKKLVEEKFSKSKDQ